jgi:hypothetical protein
MAVLTFSQMSRILDILEGGIWRVPRPLYLKSLNNIFPQNIVKSMVGPRTIVSLAPVSILRPVAI